MKSYISLQGAGRDVTSLSSIGIPYVTNASISAFTINCQGGNPSDGIFSQGSSIEITGNIIRGCIVGLFEQYASDTVSDNIITGNSSGIIQLGGSLNVSRNTIKNNGRGIGWDSSPGSMNIEGNTISDNTGTGIFAYWTDNWNIIRNVIRGNSLDIDYYGFSKVSFNANDTLNAHGGMIAGMYNVRSDGSGPAPQE